MLPPVPAAGNKNISGKDRDAGMLSVLILLAPISTHIHSPDRSAQDLVESIAMKDGKALSLRRSFHSFS